MDTHTDTSEFLRKIDSELNILFNYCREAKLSKTEIAFAASPLLKEIDCNDYWLPKFIFKLFTIVIISSCAIIYVEPINRLCCSYSRRALLQLLPYWDWTGILKDDCIIENPYHIGDILQNEDCDEFRSLETINRISNISQKVISNEYLKKNVPVIITDGMNDWLAMKLFSVHFISQLYLSDEWLYTTPPCAFFSNMRKTLDYLQLVLQKASRQEIQNWYGRWENCDPRTARIFRQFYKRPYFLPPMVELELSNWIFIASQYKARFPKPVDTNYQVILYAQIKGNTKVELIPRFPCNESLTNLYSTLHRGDILLMTDYLYDLDYLPLGSLETIAISIGGSF